MIYGVYVVVLFLVAFLYVFVCVDGNKEGILAQTKRFLWVKCPRAITDFVSKVCGDRLVYLIKRMTHYVCNEPNPIVQVLYFICAGGGFYVYVTEGFSQLPNHRVSKVHIYVSTPVMVLCYASYFAACWVDAGALNQTSSSDDIIAAVKRFKYDGVMFEKQVKCKTCKIDKPARSKHCSTCKSCVQKMDHHCVWINQCVGLYNYRFFLSFIFLHAVICSYGVWLGYHILMATVDKERLFEATFYDDSGEAVEVTSFIVFSYLQHTQYFFTAVIILCFVVSIMLWLFLGYHLHIVRQGWTTNESNKHSYLWHHLKNSEKIFTKWEEIKLVNEAAVPPEDIISQYRLDASMKLSMVQGMLKRIK